MIKKLSNMRFATGFCMVGILFVFVACSPAQDGSTVPTVPSAVQTLEQATLPTHTPTPTVMPTSTLSAATPTPSDTFSPRELVNLRTGDGGIAMSIHDIVWSPDSTRIAASVGNGSSVLIWDVVTGDMLRELTYSPRIPSQISSIDWLSRESDAQDVIVGGNNASGEVIFWDIDTQEIMQVVEDVMRGVYGLELNPDGTLLAIGRLGNRSEVSISVLDTVTGEPQYEFPINQVPLGEVEFVLDVAWSPDSGTLALAAGTRLVLWDIEGNEVPEILEVGGGEISSIDWSPVATLLATASLQSGVVTIWDTSTGTLLHRLNSEGERYTTYDSVFSPDGKVLAYGMHGTPVILVNPVTGTQLHTLDTKCRGVHVITWSPDGTTLAVAGCKIITLWQIET